jgi:cardiolipin synthase
MEGPVATMGIVYSCDWELRPETHFAPPPDVNIMPFERPAGTPFTLLPRAWFPRRLDSSGAADSLFSANIYYDHALLCSQRRLLHAICTAAQRGVDVSIILPRKNDSLLVGWASRAFLRTAGAGVKIYQFEGGLLHTKSVLVDGELSLVGTVNLDMRSLWLNFEITLVIDDAGFGGDLAAVQDDYISRSACLMPVCGKTTTLAADS